MVEEGDGVVVIMVEEDSICSIMAKEDICPCIMVQ